ncbi:unnamed protein product [Amoebophrya sp. A120]|nr:unnamed protein product [Amoebophrya sp. A120]|eukprot:GSA120T00018331001.1
MAAAAILPSERRSASEELQFFEEEGDFCIGGIELPVDDSPGSLSGLSVDEDDPSGLSSTWNNASGSGMLLEHQLKKFDATGNMLHFEQQHHNYQIPSSAAGGAVAGGAGGPPMFSNIDHQFISSTSQVHLQPTSMATGGLAAQLSSTPGAQAVPLLDGTSCTSMRDSEPHCVDLFAGAMAMPTPVVALPTPSQSPSRAVSHVTGMLTRTLERGSEDHSASGGGGGSDRTRSPSPCLVRVAPTESALAGIVPLVTSDLVEHVVDFDALFPIHWEHRHQFRGSGAPTSPGGSSLPPQGDVDHDDEVDVVPDAGMNPVEVDPEDHQHHDDDVLFRRGQAASEGEGATSEMTGTTPKLLQYDPPTRKNNKPLVVDHDGAGVTHVPPRPATPSGGPPLGAGGETNLPGGAANPNKDGEVITKEAVNMDVAAGNVILGGGLALQSPLCTSNITKRTSLGEDAGASAGTLTQEPSNPGRTVPAASVDQDMAHEDQQHEVEQGNKKDGNIHLEHQETFASNHHKNMASSKTSTSQHSTTGTLIQQVSSSPPPSLLQQEEKEILNAGGPSTSSMLMPSTTPQKCLKLANYDKILMFLDYDGTLREFEDDPVAAVPTDNLNNLLHLLSHSLKEKLKVVIISGRDAGFLDNYMGKQHQGLTLVAEHGYQIRHAYETEWTIAGTTSTGGGGTSFSDVTSSMATGGGPTMAADALLDNLNLLGTTTGAVVGAAGASGGSSSTNLLVPTLSQVSTATDHATSLGTMNSPSPASGGLNLHTSTTTAMGSNAISTASGGAGAGTTQNTVAASGAATSSMQHLQQQIPSPSGGGTTSGSMLSTTTMLGSSSTNAPGGGPAVVSSSQQEMTSGSASSQLFDHQQDWRSAVMNEMKKLANVHGSFVEEKTKSLVWHYRACRPEEGQEGVDQLLQLLEFSLQYPMARVSRGNKMIEVFGPQGPTKGGAMRDLILRFLHEFGESCRTLVFCAGDDVTDETMFALADDEALFSRKTHLLSIKVGQGKTLARYRVENPSELRLVLSAMLQKFGYSPLNSGLLSTTQDPPLAGAALLSPPVLVEGHADTFPARPGAKPTVDELFGNSTNSAAEVAVLKNDDPGDEHH